MKRIFSLMFSLVLLLSCSVLVYADSDDFEDLDEENTSSWIDLLPTPEDLPVSTRAPDPEPEPTSVLEQFSAQALSEPGIMSLDNTFGGTWNGSVLDYFEGYVLNHFTDHYVAFRQSQNVYVLYVGKISYKNGRYVGNDLDIVTYTYNYSQSNEYVSFSRGNLDQYVDGIYYSDLEGGSAFVSQKICFLLLCVGILCAVFNLARLFHSFFSRS